VTGAVPLRSGGGLLYRPASDAVALVVVLHGAGGAPEQAIDLLRPHADEVGLVLVAPKSQGVTWDLILGGFGPDLVAIDSAIDEAAVATDVVAIGGFSDGASYALSVGLGAGDRFDAIVAFSPGFAAPTTQVGKPRVFLSHGTHDQVLPIERCGRHVAAVLRRAGYDVTYSEFEGGHDVPPQLRHAAATWIPGGAT
jgi:phospholipase/carboxylesterase